MDKQEMLKKHQEQGIIRPSLSMLNTHFSRRNMFDVNVSGKQPSFIHRLISRIGIFLAIVLTLGLVLAGMTVPHPAMAATQNHHAEPAILKISHKKLGVSSLQPRVLKAATPWPGDTDSAWHTSGTVKWAVKDDTLFFKPVSGDTGTFGRWGDYQVPWGYTSGIDLSHVINIEAKGTLTFPPNATLLDAFSNMSDLTNISGLSHFDTSEVTNMNDMFSMCVSLSKLTGLENWDTSKVKNMATMFFSCLKLSDLSSLSNWNTSNVTDMSQMFSSCPELTDLFGLKNWDVSNVTNMSSMFYSCAKLTDLSGLKNWDVSSVTNMSSMFANGSDLASYALTSLSGLEHWNTSNVTNMSEMFLKCSSLKNISSLAHWNTSNVTSMSTMFAGCTSLKDLSSLKNWDLSQSETPYGTVEMFMSVPWEKIGIPSSAHAGYKFLIRERDSGLYDNSATTPNDIPTIVPEDGSKDPIKMNVPNSEATSGQDGGLALAMQTSPSDYPKGLVWIRYQGSYIVAYNANGGNGSMPAAFVKNIHDKVILPSPTFFRFGYVFIGWSTQADDQTKLFQPKTPWSPNSPKEGQRYTLYAQWTQRFNPGTLPHEHEGGMLPGWVQTAASGTQGLIAASAITDASFTNKYEPNSAQIAFRLTKLVDGEAPSASQSYKFDLLDSDNKTVVQTVENSGSTIRFAPVTFTNTGTYTYYAREEASSVPSTEEADSHVTQITVTVKDDPDHAGQLLATAEYVGNTTFNNTTHSGQLTVKKLVTGTADTSKTFTIHIHAEKKDKTALAGKYGPVKFDDNGDATIGLSAGQSDTLSGLPAGTAYTVTEPHEPDGYKLQSISGASGVIEPDKTFETDVTNSYTASPAHVTLEMSKRVLLGPHQIPGKVKADAYSFTLEKVTDEDCANAVGVSSTQVQADGSIIFPQLTFDKPSKALYYCAAEVDSSKEGVDYDSSTKVIEITVTDNGSGKLVPVVNYVKSLPDSPDVTAHKQFTNKLPQIGSMPNTGKTGIAPCLLFCLFVMVLSVILLVKQG